MRDGLAMQARSQPAVPFGCPTQERLSRRHFLASCAAGAATLWVGGTLARRVLAATKRTNLKEAMYWRSLPGGKTQCLLCPNQCVRGPGEDGLCHARGNRNGRYYSLVYGIPCVIALDEVEKCPLNHFQVQGKAFSLATAGCNLTCKYCQNWQFSQVGPDEVPRAYDLSPEAAVAKAIEQRAGAIAYFYTEPVVYYEYMLATAMLARRRNLKNVMVTAGYISPEPFKNVLPYIDAVAFGLKGWNEKFYQEYIGCELKYIKESMQLLAQMPEVWWEVVVLIVPSLNDRMDEIAAMAKWLRDVAGPERPLHFTRFRPEYRLKTLPMTPAATLTRAREVAIQQGLKYVYVGNLPGHEGGNTYCPQCGKVVLERVLFTVVKKHMSFGNCIACGYKIAGVWQ